MGFIVGYIKKYKIIYISIFVVFILGIIIGDFILLNISEENKKEIKIFIMNAVKESKENGINELSVFKNSIVSNVKFVSILYFLGCSIIASFCIYIAILYKGFLIGYTSMAFIITYGVKESIKYLLLVIILHNVVYLPFVFLLATSGIRMYKEIMRKASNLRLELLRHSIIMLFCLVFCIVSSGIESYFSTFIFEIL